MCLETCNFVREVLSEKGGSKGCANCQGQVGTIRSTERRKEE